VSNEDERIRQAVASTEILRSPKQNLYTFGTTNIYYYLVTEPAYAGVIGDATETVIREGRVRAEKPKIVTPHYLYGLDGFSDDARRYFEQLIEAYGPNMPGLLYTYRNEPGEMNIVSDHWRTVVEKLNARIDDKGDQLAAIIKGTDELWDVALMKFIFDMTQRSLSGNVGQLEAKGLLKIDDQGIPADGRRRIEELFGEVRRGETAAAVLKDELDRWGVFSEYEDRFLGIFRK
jgi:hypothetical protein